MYLHQYIKIYILLCIYNFLDVIGHVVACDDLDNYDKNGRSGKKKPLTLADAELVQHLCSVFLIFFIHILVFFLFSMFLQW